MSRLRFVTRFAALGSAVGVLAGLASAGFLVTLDWATETRLREPWLVWLLPLAGFAVGLVYHYAGGRAAQGNNLILDEIHTPKDWIPRRMAPLVYGGTVVTQLFGGSAGREGAAIQMSGGLTDMFNRAARIRLEDRRPLLVAAIAGGFGAVFGVPLAGVVFALEVQAVGRMRYDALVPAVAASVVGNQVVHGLGVDHVPTPRLGDVDLTWALTGEILVAGVVFGLAAAAFIAFTHLVRQGFARWVHWPPLRPLLGGFAIVGLTALVGTRDYLGLSLELIDQALDTAIPVATFAFAAKLLFTSVTLGSGFQGGEVTPLFVIGATLGATLDQAFGNEVVLLAALGYVAVFGAAANTPIACTVMGLELFGVGAAVPLLLACVVAYLASSHRSIYTSQRLDTPKGPQPP